MAANSSGLKKKKLVLLMMMMLQDEEASSKFDSRKVWARKWFLRRPEKGSFVFVTLHEVSSLFLMSIICTESSSTLSAAILKVSSQ